jgi:hypothetical protein
VDSDSSDEREIRAARNQALFRSVNERLTQMEAAGPPPATLVIACECADTSCVQTLEVPPDVYTTVRANPRHFVVLKGHVYPDVEDVVAEADHYAVVEKLAKAAQVAEDLSERP